MFHEDAASNFSDKAFSSKCSETGTLRPRQFMTTMLREAKGECHLKARHISLARPPAADTTSRSHVVVVKCGIPTTKLVASATTGENEPKLARKEAYKSSRSPGVLHSGDYQNRRTNTRLHERE